MKSDLPYLGHIADSIAAIETYVTGGRDAFMAQRLIQDAVLRNFEIIGEAASRLSTAARQDSGDLPELKREVTRLLRTHDRGRSKPPSSK